MPHIVVIGGSAGSIDALKIILAGLPRDFPAAVLVVSHIGSRESLLPSLFARHATLPVRHPLQGDPIVAGEVLVAPPDLHLTVANSGDKLFVHLSRGPKENHSRPAIDPLFRSAASAAGAGVIAVLLSGYLDDGTIGLQAVKACGGIAVVQDPADAEVQDMPASALKYAEVDFVRRAQDIAPLLAGLVRSEATEQPRDAELQGWIRVENRMLEESSAMKDLDRIGARVPLTCPECGGAIWEIHQSSPVRYRCHTGHAFTARVLESLQGNTLEEALWGAVRALHEQEQLFQRMAQTIGDGEYQAKAEQARQHGQVLRDLIVAHLGVTEP